MNYDHSLPRESSKVNRSIFLLTLHSLMPFRRKYRNNIKLITDYHVLFAMGFFLLFVCFFPRKLSIPFFFRPDIFVWWAVNTQHASLTGFHLNCERQKIRKKNFISFYLRYWILQQKRLYTSIAPNQIELNHITSHFIDEYVNPHVTATSFSTLTTELFEFCDVHVMPFF